MSAQTGIEWADSTFNPWMGCTKISPACDHCYAERDTKRFGLVQWGAGQPRRPTSAVNWRAPERWSREKWVECPECRWRGNWEEADHMWGACPKCECVPDQFITTRRRVFCASLADWLDNEVPIEWLIDLLDLIRRTPNLDWLLLTKRIGNWRTQLQRVHDWCEARLWLVSGDSFDRAKAVAIFTRDWMNDAPPLNVWLGSTVVNQAEADRDVPKLLDVLARVRFLSIEPMLGPIDLQRWLWQCCGDMQQGNDHGMLGQEPDRCCGRPDPRDALHWVICGGESGPHARPMHPDWVRGLRDQCAAAGVPFLFKQWGEWAPGHIEHGNELAYELMVDARQSAWPEGHCSFRVGKRAAGRLLDGVEHNGFPGVVP